MITTRHMAVEVEFVRWLLLVLAAIALMLAIATALAAADPMSEPRLLPADLGRIAKPLAGDVVQPYFPELPPGRVLPPAEAAARLWMTLESQRAGCSGEALAGWEAIAFPAETAHWREIGMGAAYLQAGDLIHAELHLDMARQLAPGQAVVSYLTGLLRLEQAAAVGRVPMEVRPQLRLVAYGPHEERIQYQMLAVAELQQAIARASEVRLDERLLMLDPQIDEAVVVPRVGDLLVAMGADNFVGKAHHLLYGLYLESGELTVAEIHLDRAVAMQIAPLYGYRDLAEVYLHEGRNTDVVRAVHKDLAANHCWVLQLGERCGRLFRTAAAEAWTW